METDPPPAPPPKDPPREPADSAESAQHREHASEIGDRVGPSDDRRRRDASG